MRNQHSPRGRPRLDLLSSAIKGSKAPGPLHLQNLSLSRDLTEGRLPPALAEQALHGAVLVDATFYTKSVESSGLVAGGMEYFVRSFRDASSSRGQPSAATRAGALRTPEIDFDSLLSVADRRFRLGSCERLVDAISRQLVSKPVDDFLEPIIREIDLYSRIDSACDQPLNMEQAREVADLLATVAGEPTLVKSIWGDAEIGSWIEQTALKLCEVLSADDKRDWSSTKDQFEVVTVLALHVSTLVSSKLEQIRPEKHSYARSYAEGGPLSDSLNRIYYGLFSRVAELLEQKKSFEFFNNVYVNYYSQVFADRTLESLRNNADLGQMARTGLQASEFLLRLLRETSEKSSLRKLEELSAKTTSLPTTPLHWKADSPLGSIFLFRPTQDPNIPWLCYFSESWEESESIVGIDHRMKSGTTLQTLKFRGDELDLPGSFYAVRTPDGRYIVDHRHTYLRGHSAIRDSSAAPHLERIRENCVHKLNELMRDHWKIFTLLLDLGTAGFVLDDSRCIFMCQNRNSSIIQEIVGHLPLGEADVLALCHEVGLDSKHAKKMSAFDLQPPARNVAATLVETVERAGGANARSRLVEGIRSDGFDFGMFKSTMESMGWGQVKWSKDAHYAFRKVDGGADQGTLILPQSIHRSPRRLVQLVGRALDYHGIPIQTFVEHLERVKGKKR